MTDALADPPPFRVLVCDDQEALRTTIATVVDNTSPFQVTAQAADGTSCLAQLTTARPHVLILDVNVPDGGPALAHAVRERDPEVYILVYTSHRNPEIREQMLAAGADGYLVKTGRLAPLLEALRGATELA